MEPPAFATMWPGISLRKDCFLHEVIFKKGQSGQVEFLRQAWFCTKWPKRIFNKSRLLLFVGNPFPEICWEPCREPCREPYRRKPYTVGNSSREPFEMLGNNLKPQRPGKRRVGQQSQDIANQTSCKKSFSFHMVTRCSCNFSSGVLIENLGDHYNVSLGAEAYWLSY